MLTALWLSLISVIVIAIPLHAQQPITTLSIAPDTCTIGDDIFYTLNVLKKSSIQLSYPTLSDSAVFAPFEIRQVEMLPAEARENLMLEKIRYTLTVFDTGMQTVPAISLAYLDKETQRQDTIVLEQKSVYVKSVLDTARKDIADIKPVRSVPIPLWVYLTGGALLLVLAIGIYFLVRYWRARAPAPVPVPAPALTPYEVAFAKLKGLEELTLNSQNDFKIYYSAISDAVREFLERHYGFPAMEQLTSEIEATLQAKRPKEEVERVKNLLEKADLVKFAKFQPTVSEAKESLSVAFQIIEIGRPRETTDLPNRSTLRNHV
ncbi:MAG: hypothetical protein ACK41G_09670 [Candidatus Thermochlorobacter sp.]